METIERPTVCDCGHEPTPDGLGSGYARTADGRTMCYLCADELQRLEMATVDRFTAYVSSDGRTLTTWSGGVLGRCTLAGRHPWSSERQYLRATDVHGNRWHGTGAPGMYACLRRAKADRS